VIGLLQRVSGASVDVDGQRIAEIGTGLLVLIGVERGDARPQADRLLERLLNYRVFGDARGHMNESLRDVDGSLLLVPQFTLPADTRKGNRPGFSTAAAPELGRELFDYLAAQARALHPAVECGRFGAEMRVSLVNEGPVTFWLQVEPVR
jgi:D-tyrosyl-tRNA(Tyr) deacylase